jgi:putative tryptophan/tyrosine transport system substrate-binding protein
MRRRDFIAGLMFAAATGRAQAQQSGKVYRIAFAHPTVPVADQNQASKGSLAIPAIFEELIRLGYVEGRNLLIERYSGEGRALRYPDLAHQIVSRNPDLIIAIGGFVLELKAATSTIPIVGSFADPIGLGIVPSLARPGGNITGVSVDVGIDQWLKRVQLLKEAVPQITRWGALDTRDGRESDYGKKVHAIERENGVNIVGPALERPTDEQEYRRVFAALAQEGVEGLVVNDQPENVTNRRLIVELAAKHRLPTIYPYRQFVEAGGLMSYGIDTVDIGHRVADLADKILKGAKPGEIPIFQPTHFELSINLKTAKTLGIEPPPLLVARADKVIE